MYTVSIKGSAGLFLIAFSLCLALTAYAFYVFNAGQFLLKLRAARKQSDVLADRGDMQVSPAE